MELSEQQLLYLQTIFNYFHINGAWPSYRHLEHELDQIDANLDIESLAKSLPDGLSNEFLAGGNAILTIPAIQLCQGAEGDLEDFVWLIRLCTEHYLVSTDEVPFFSSDDLYNQLRMSELSISRVGLLVEIEPGIYQGFAGNPEVGNWYFQIAHDIRRFRGVTTLAQYLEKRDQLKRVVGTTIDEPVVSVEAVDELQLHPAIRAQCWDLYTVNNFDNAVLNATKLLEINVRQKARLPITLVGVDVMNQALGNNPRLGYGEIEAERLGLMSLLRGMIQVFKNPQSHRFVGMRSKAECLSVLLMCSTLLYIIDNVEYIGSTSPG